MKETFQQSKKKTKFARKIKESKQELCWVGDHVTISFDNRPLTSMVRYFTNEIHINRRNT